MAKVAGHALVREFGKRAGKLDPGGPAANDDEGQQAGAQVRIGRRLGLLKRQEDATSDSGRVADLLQTRRERRPLVVAEIGVPRPSRDDQIVVRDAPLIDQHLAGCSVDVGNPAENHLGVALPAQDGTDRLGDVGGRERCGRDLIEQRLKQVIVAAVDHRDLDGRAFQRLGRG
jgi:hypothetical protein